MAVWTFRIYNNPVTPTLIPFLRLFRRNIPAISIPPELLTILFTTDAWSDAKSCAWKYHIWRRAINGNYRSDSRLHTEPLLFLRNHRFEKRSMVHGKLLFPLLVSIFIIVGKSTTTRDSTRFQNGISLHLPIIPGLRVFLNQRSRRRKKLLWFVNDVWLQRVITFGVITNHEISISVKLRTEEPDRRGNIVDS